MKLGPAKDELQSDWLSLEALQILLPFPRDPAVDVVDGSQLRLPCFVSRDHFTPLVLDLYPEIAPLIGLIVEDTSPGSIWTRLRSRQ